MLTNAPDGDQSRERSSLFKDMLRSLFPSLVFVLSMDVRSPELGKFILNFLWFVFITMFMGQLGVVLAAGWAFWNDQSVFEAIRLQADAGNLLTFSLALLAGSVYFMVKEFHDGNGFKFAYLKSPLLLISILVGFGGALISASLTISTEQRMTDIQWFWHWILYFLCVILSVFWWTLEIRQDALRKHNQEIKSQADDLTNKSKKPRTQSKTGIKV